MGSSLLHSLSRFHTSKWALAKLRCNINNTGICSASTNKQIQNWIKNASLIERRTLWQSNSDNTTWAINNIIVSVQRLNIVFDAAATTNWSEASLAPLISYNVNWCVYTNKRPLRMAIDGIKKKVFKVENIQTHFGVSAPQFLFLFSFSLQLEWGLNANDCATMPLTMNIAQTQWNTCLQCDKWILFRVGRRRCCHIFSLQQVVYVLPLISEIQFKFSSIEMPPQMVFCITRLLPKWILTKIIQFSVESSIVHKMSCQLKCY